MTLRLVIAGAIILVAVLSAWVLAGRALISFLDRFGTVREGDLPVGDFGIDANEFLIGRHRWHLGKTLRVAPDSQKRVSVSWQGITFTLGPMTCCYASPEPHYDFTPDPGDRISFVKRHSRAAWPTPLEFSIMGGSVPSWRRRSYNRLSWRKASGARLDLVWRDEEDFFRGKGWADRNWQYPPAIRIVRSPFESAVDRYVARQRGWKPEEYRLESRGASTDGRCEVMAVIAHADERAAHPGAGLSFEVHVDRASGRVVKEVGGQ